MNPNNSKISKDTDQLELETEDSPSTVNLADGDLKIYPTDNHKNNSTSKHSESYKKSIERIETKIELIKKISRKKRVKGDLSDYFTCHGCQGFMEAKYLLVCSFKECSRYFCFRCANKKFHSSPAEIAQMIEEKDWICYSCKNMCNCRICKKIFLEKEPAFLTQLNTFERAKKRPAAKEDDKADKVNDETDNSETSEPQEEIKKSPKPRNEKDKRSSHSEDPKAKSKGNDKENHKENAKEKKSEKVIESNNKKQSTGKDKSSSRSKHVEEPVKEQKSNTSKGEVQKSNQKNDKKVDEKVENKKTVINKLTSKLQKQSTTTNKPKSKNSKANKSVESSEEEESEESAEEEEKKIVVKETKQSKTLEIKEKDREKAKDKEYDKEKDKDKAKEKENDKEKDKEKEKPTKLVEQAKPEKKEDLENKKLEKPKLKIKRELKQLLKMNDEIPDFEKLIDEPSFEISNHISFEERSNTNSIEPRKIVRRFRAKPEDVCHLCKNIYEKEFLFPCTVSGCDKSFCSFCIRSNFMQDFDPKIFKADQFICYVCGKFCKCKECDKTTYHSNKRRAKRNEMRMGSSRRGKRSKGHRQVETRRRKFYDTLPDEYNPNDPSQLEDSMNNDYAYDRDLEDEMDENNSDSDDSESRDENNRFILRKKRFKMKAISEAEVVKGSSTSQ